MQAGFQPAVSGRRARAGGLRAFLRGRVGPGLGLGLTGRSAGVAPAPPAALAAAAEPPEAGPRGGARLRRRHSASAGAVVPAASHSAEAVLNAAEALQRDIAVAQELDTMLLGVIATLQGEQATHVRRMLVLRLEQCRLELSRLRHLQMLALIDSIAAQAESGQLRRRLLEGDVRQLLTGLLVRAQNEAQDPEPRFTPASKAELDGLVSLSTSGAHGAHERVEGRCTICLEDLEAGEELSAVAACRHWHHDGCLREWMRVQNGCPLCRSASSAACGVDYSSESGGEDYSRVSPDYPAVVELL